MTTAPPRPAVETPTAAPEGPLVPRGVLWGAAAGLVGVLVLALLAGGARPATGLASAGPVVDWGRPVATLATRIAAVGTVGALLFAAVLHPRPASATWRRAVRAASAWGLAWAATTVVATWLTLCELVGAGPLAVPASAVGTFVTDLPGGRAALATLTAALAIAVVTAFRPSLDALRLLLGAAAGGLLVPVFLTGHSAAAEDHVLAVNNLALHVVTATLWVGGLLALVAFGRRSDDLPSAAARFSALALGCFVLVGASGVLAAWLVLTEAGGSPADALGTGYGALLLAKTAGLVALGLFGWRHRRRTLPRLRAGESRSFRRFAVVETGVMLVTVALAVALASSPPPAAAPAAEAPLAPAAAEAEKPAADPMAGHDHGELSVSVLIDETRYHVAGPVEAGSRVTVHNTSGTEVTITAEDGSFDVVVPDKALMTFVAPAEPGRYAFGSAHSDAYEDVLGVE